MGEERDNAEKESCEGGGLACVSTCVVMDTPERKQIAANPLSKFEDSPVYNFINNLSPIKPVKSMHITQTFNSLSFASLPSVFTSPHVSSLKESRFLRRHQFPDPSKSEFSSDNENKGGNGMRECNIDGAHNCSELQENFDPGSSVAEASVETTYDCSKLEIELSRTLNYDCVSPDTKKVAEMAATASIVPFVQGGSESCPSENEVNILGISPVDQNKAASGCDWENLIVDAADLLLFESPIDAKPQGSPCQKSLDSIKCHEDDLLNTQAYDVLVSNEQHELENPSVEGGDLKEFAEDQVLPRTSLNNLVAGEPAENINNELGSNLNRGMRRRCLVFEMGGSRRKHFDAGSTSGSSSLQSHETIAASGDRCLVPIKPDSSRRILPGIGLHLNALATTSTDQKLVKNESLPSGGQLIIAPPSSATYHSLAAGNESVNGLSAATSSDRDTAPAQNGVSVVDDTSQALEYMCNEELNPSSPKKKRCKVEHAGEPEACKRCNCKKSKCLKLYCECFAAGVYCVEPCSCQECFNKPVHEDTVLATRKQIESRNPLAFAPKVIRSSDSVIEIGDESSKTPASARHKRGCNCKKSGCLKKYCECYQGGVGCSVNCRCEGCKNAFGRKDGSEAELEDEIDECERSVMDRSMPKAVVQIEVEQNSATPGTPLRFGRQSIQPPISSKGKPPRSFLAIGSSGIHTIQRFGKPNPIQVQGKFEKHFPTVQEQDEMPEILQGNGSPISGIKSASPKSKRVSPPHCAIRPSPGQRSSRKLILQSIPSFPSLTPNKH